MLPQQENFDFVAINGGYYAVEMASNHQTRPYFGRLLTEPREEVFFDCSENVTEEKYGKKYAWVTGPFLTKKGAEFMRDYGQNNPHCCSVEDAECLVHQQTKPVELSPFEYVGEPSTWERMMGRGEYATGK